MCNGVIVELTTTDGSMSINPGPYSSLEETLEQLEELHAYFSGDTNKGRAARKPDPEDNPNPPKKSRGRKNENEYTLNTDIHLRISDKTTSCDARSQLSWMGSDLPPVTKTWKGCVSNKSPSCNNNCGNSINNWRAKRSNLNKPVLRLTHSRLSFNSSQSVTMELYPMDLA